MKSLYKIAHTCASSLWQDPEKRILDESLWMQDQGHQVIIIAPKDSPLLTRAKAVGLSAYPMSFRGLSLAGQAQQLREILSNEQPQILNAHGRTDGRISLRAAKKAGVPCRIISRHSAKSLKNTWQNRTLFKKLPHYVFTASDAVTEQLKTVFRLKDMEIFSIPGGIIPPRSLTDRDEARKTMAAALGLEEGAAFMGLLAPCDTRLAASHAVRLFKAVKQLRMEVPHHLLVQGTTMETEKILKHAVDKANLTGRVHLVESGNRWHFYRSLACGVHLPSRPHDSGSIPRAILEAMYASCPVVAQRSEGIMEAVDHEKTGLLWDPSRPEEAADAIQETLTRTAAARERTHAARETVKSHHTIDTMGRDLIRIYRLHQVRLERRYHKVEDPDLY